MMNKKLLILSAIATGLLLTACVKKESPNEQEQAQVASEPTEFHSLEATTPEETIPAHVETETTEVQITTTETPRTEVQKPSHDTSVAPATEPTQPVPTQKPVTKPVTAVEEKPAAPVTQPAKANNHNTSGQSEDDAVAAAVAAAMPALKN